MKATRVLLLFVALSPTLKAAPVIYTFSGVVNMFGTRQTFQYTAPDFIMADLFVPASELESCTNELGGRPCFGMNFLLSGPDTPEHFPEVLFQTTNPDSSIGTVFYYFPLSGGFAAPSSINTIPTLGNNGVLTILPVSEPSTGALLSIGLLLVALVRRVSQHQRKSPCT